MSYNKWQRLENTEVGKPYYFTIKPNDNSLLFHPLDVNYEVALRYYKTPQILTDNLDVPRLPQAFHTLLMYKGIINSAVFFSSQELYQYAVIRSEQMMGQLMREQLPELKMKFRSLV